MTVKENIFSIQKKFKFEAAHKLSHLNYDTPCKNLHGHSYTVIVEIGALGVNNDTNMILDFNKFKPFKDYLDNEWDHSILVANNENIDEYKKVFPSTKIKVVQNEICSLSSTTSETIAFVLCYDCIKLLGLKKHQFEYIKVFVGETENNTASYMLYSCNLPFNFITN